MKPLSAMIVINNTNKRDNDPRDFRAMALLVIEAREGGGTGVAESDLRLRVHLLARLYCELSGVSQSAFANRVAARAGQGADNDTISEEVKRFLTHGTTKSFTRRRLAIVDELRLAFADMPPLHGLSLGDVLETTVTGEGAVSPHDLSEFYTRYLREPHIAKTMRNHLEDRQREAETQAFSSIVNGRHIAKVFGIVAQAFDVEADDITPVDNRLIDRQHFSFIRPTSGEEGAYVVHGLKFARHTDFPGYMYFSEKYERHHSVGDNLGSRVSQGVGFIDGRSIHGIARPANTDTFTYFQAERPRVDNFRYFDAVMMTSNSSGAAIAARGLCLPSRDQDEKRRLVGCFGPGELMSSLEESQREIVATWLDDPRRNGLIRL